MKELKEIDEAVGPKEAEKTGADTDEQVWIHNCLTIRIIRICSITLINTLVIVIIFIQEMNHLTSSQVLASSNFIIFTQKAKDHVADEEPSNESLQEKVNMPYYGSLLA